MGPVGNFDFYLKDKNKIVKDEKICLEMLTGKPAQLKANGLKEQTLSLQNYSKTPQFVITVHDGK